jgi:hypothetical protein
VQHIIRHIVILCLLANIASCAVAQPSTTSVQGKVVLFTVDNLGNQYLLNEKNQLKKINARGDSIAVFNDVRRYGKLTRIDASNPLKVLLFYQNFATIVVVDRFLNVVNKMDLRNYNILQPTAIATANDNAIWIFDDLQHKLLKIDDAGKLVLETADMRMLLQDAPVPQTIIDRDNFVYLYDSLRGLTVWDYFGTLKNRFPYKSWQSPQVLAGNLFAIKDSLIIRLNIATLDETASTLPAPMQNADGYLLTYGRLYALKNGQVISIGLEK